jgi:hypothetical protein
MDKPLMNFSSKETFILAVIANDQEADVLLHADKGNEMQLLQLFSAVVQSMMKKGYDQRSMEMAFASAVHRANFMNL